jgi:hypothetical protein
MHSHLLLLVIFAVLTALVFAVLQRDTPRDQARLWVLLVAGFLGAALVLGWVMYPFPGGPG